MAHVRKDMLRPSGEWWKHLRWTKRPFWKSHRKAEQRLAETWDQDEDEMIRQEVEGMLAWIAMKEGVSAP
jgi:hypothetical protein